MVRFVEIEVNEENETSLLTIIKNSGRLCVPTKCVRNSLELHTFAQCVFVFLLHTSRQCDYVMKIGESLCLTNGLVPFTNESLFLFIRFVHVPAAQPHSYQTL